MKAQLEAIREECFSEVKAAESTDALQQIRQKYLGKKSNLSNVLKGLGKLSDEERKTIGRVANEIKLAITEAFESREKELIEEASVFTTDPDLTLPGLSAAGGGLHPITQMCYDLNDAFRSLNFEVFMGNEITSEKYAFDNLNFSPDHPARESMDT